MRRQVVVARPALKLERKIDGAVVELSSIVDSLMLQTVLIYLMEINASVTIYHFRLQPPEQLPAANLERTGSYSPCSKWSCIAAVWHRR